MRTAIVGRVVQGGGTTSHLAFAAEVAQLLELGATELRGGRQGPARRIMLADPRRRRRALRLPNPGRRRPIVAT